MRKYLYVKDIDKDILQTLFGYRKYRSNPKISDLEDFRLPERLAWFFRTGEMEKNGNVGKCSFYIDIFNADLSDEDREFLSDISHVAIEDRFAKTNYHKIDLFHLIPMNGFKKAMYCCISFAKKYPNTEITLKSKYNEDIYLAFEYNNTTDKMSLKIVVNLLNTINGNNIVKKIGNATFTKPLIFIYDHEKDDIYKFEKEVISTWQEKV